MAWISSISSTVLPTPAPPNIAVLLPNASGTSRSITLMPVSNTVDAAVCAASGGGARWIGSQGVSAGNGGPWSCTAPMTSSNRPSTASPTGAVSGPPVGCTSVPRRSPDVACKAMARTVPASRWLCTSAISRRLSSSMCSASLIAGSRPASKATSNTAPRTARTRPRLATEADIGQADSVTASGDCAMARITSARLTMPISLSPRTIGRRLMR